MIYYVKIIDLVLPEHWVCTAQLDQCNRVPEPPVESYQLCYWHLGEQTWTATSSCVCPSVGQRNALIWNPSQTFQKLSHQKPAEWKPNTSWTGGVKTFPRLISILLGTWEKTIMNNRHMRRMRNPSYKCIKMIKK